MDDPKQCCCYNGVECPLCESHGNLPYMHRINWSGSTTPFAATPRPRPAEWTVKPSQIEWSDGLEWHAITETLVSPEGEKVSLEEAAAVLNAMVRQLQLLTDMPALISG